MSSSLKKAVQSTLAGFGVEVRRAGHDWSDTAQFIPLEETLAAARAAGLSVGDYIDTVMNNIPGATQATIDGMRELGVFAGKIESVVEIGPGSGRYLEKTIEACHPAQYTAYETALPWVKYLRDTYPSAVVHPTEGARLDQTADASCDLVHAHKVFSSVDLRVSLCYWQELVRVTRSGGHVVFDIMTESGMTPDLIDAWIAGGHDTGAHPACVPRAACIGYFAAHRFAHRGSFMIPMGPAVTEVFVFQRLP
jgi:SAM-dependent methyltransferase